MIDWGKSYTSIWRVFKVDMRTWADGEAVKNIDSISLTRDANGDLIESGGLESTGEFESGYYRVVMTAEQGADIERVDVATLLFLADKGSIDYGTTTSDVNGYSVLYPASTTAVTTGEYAPAGIDGVIYAKELLESCIQAPVETEGSFTLNEHIVHDLNANVIDAVWAVLDAYGYIIQIDGRGVVRIMPKPSQPSLVIDSNATSFVMNNIDYSSDMSDIPNRYVVIEDTDMFIAVNDNPLSSVSTVARGYTVDEIDNSPTLVNGETYEEYAERMLHELSVLKEERSYTREYAPDVYPYSIVRGSITGLEGDFRVSSQSITCDHGITVSEKAYKETYLW